MAHNLLNTPAVPTTVLSTLQASSHFTPLTACEAETESLHFADEEVETRTAK